VGARLGACEHGAAPHAPPLPQASQPRPRHSVRGRACGGPGGGGWRAGVRGRGAARARGEGAGGHRDARARDRPAEAPGPRGHAGGGIRPPPGRWVGSAREGEGPGSSALRGRLGERGGNVRCSRPARVRGGFDRRQGPGGSHVTARSAGQCRWVKETPRVTPGGPRTTFSGVPHGDNRIRVAIGGASRRIGHGGGAQGRGREMCPQPRGLSGTPAAHAGSTTLVKSPRIHLRLTEPVTGGGALPKRDAERKVSLGGARGGSPASSLPPSRRMRLNYWKRGESGGKVGEGGRGEGKDSVRLGCQNSSRQLPGAVEMGGMPVSCLSLNLALSRWTQKRGDSSLIQTTRRGLLVRSVTRVPARIASPQYPSPIILPIA